MRTKDEINAAIQMLESSGSSDANTHLSLAQAYQELALHQDVDREKINEYHKNMFAHCQQAAQLGAPGAYYYLGYCHEKGFGTPQDQQQAFDCYINAAEKMQDPYAQYRLALCYQQGEMTQKNLNEAFFWFQRAASYLKSAEFALADCYANGYGTEKNLMLAYCFYRKAAEQRHAAAAYQLACYLFTGIPDVVEEDQTEACRFLHQAAEDDHSEAQYRLAFWYAAGRQVKLEPQKAFMWWKRAADNSAAPHALALWYVADCYAKGYGCEASSLLSGHYYTIAKPALEKIKHQNKEANELFLCEPGQTRPMDLPILPPSDKPKYNFVKSYHKKTTESLHDIWNRTRYSAAMSLLHQQVIRGDVILLTKTIDSGTCLINAYDDFGHTPLEYAAAFGYVECVAALLDAGVANQSNDIDEHREIFRALELAIAGNYVDLVYLLAVHPNFNAVLQTEDERADTLLHVAARFDSVFALSALISCSKAVLLNPNSYNAEGLAPLHIAVQNGSKNIINYLLAQNADIHCKTLTGKTALEIATENNNKETVTVLLAAGAEITLAVEALAQGKELYALFDREKRLRTERAKQQTHPLTKIRNLVFKGGGVKGIGHIGALVALKEMAGQVFFDSLKRTVGTSAGAINAFCLAIGFTPEQMQQKMLALDFHDFMDGDQKDFIDQIIVMCNQGLSPEKIIQELDPEISRLSLFSTTAVKRGQEAFSAFKGVKKDQFFTQKVKQIKAASHVIFKAGLSISATCETLMGLPKIFALLTQLKGAFTGIGKNYGIFPGKSAITLFEKWLIEDAKLPADLTFAGLAKLHQQDDKKYKLLYLVATNLSQARVEIFSHEHTPEVYVVDAVRASMSIPIFFQAWHIRCKKLEEEQFYSNDHYVDGGMIYNFPVDLLDYARYRQAKDDITAYADADTHIHNDQTLGLCLVTHADQSRLNWHPGDGSANGQPIESLLSYVSKIVLLYLRQEDELHAVRGHDKNRTIYINSLGISTVDFALNSENQSALLQSGELAARHFANDIAMPACQVMVMHNTTLAAYLASRSSLLLVMTSRGIDFRQMKLSISTPHDLYHLLLHIHTKQDRDLLAQLPLDINCRDKDTGNTLLSGLLDRLNVKEIQTKDQEMIQQVIRQLFELQKSFVVMLDFNACDKDGNSILDKAWEIYHLYLDILVQCIEAGAVLAKKHYQEAIIKYLALPDNKELTDRYKTDDIKRLSTLFTNNLKKVELKSAAQNLSVQCQL